MNAQSKGQPVDELRLKVTNLLNDLFEMGYWCGVNDSDETQPHHVKQRTDTFMELIQAECNKARIDQVHKDFGGYSYAMPIKSVRTRNTAFKLYAIKFFNSTIKKRREAQLQQLMKGKK